MNVKQLIIDTINSKYNYPIILQGSMSENETYPNSFFTFWNNDSFDDEFYDNRGTQVIWEFDLNFYSTDPQKIEDVLSNVINALKEKGFIIDGKGHDVMSDESTHTGRGITVIYVEKL